MNPESVYFEDNLPFQTVVSRLQQAQFQLFPESDNFYIPNVWMLHGWFHSLNPDGTFANTHPNLSSYAPEDFGAHSEHHHTAPLIAGTDDGEQLLGTSEDDQINSFGGDDVVVGRRGNDLIWGSYGNDLLRGDLKNSSSSSQEGGDDMLYGGPGEDRIYGQAGNDRLFGGMDDDKIWGGEGDDLLRGGFGNDILTGDDRSSNADGSDIFVLACGEGYDRITDFEIEVDTLVLYGGVALEELSIKQIKSDTWIGFESEILPLAILNGVNATDLIAANAFTVA